MGAGRSNIASLTALMDLRSREFQQGMQQSIRSMDRMDAKTKQLNRQMGTFGRNVARAGTALLAFAGIHLGAGLVTDLIATAWSR